MKIYTNWAFLRPVNTSLHGDFTIENPSFSMYLLSTQEHTIPLCVKILQILFWLELSWFWIEGNGRFWDFLTFYVPLCSKKLSVHCSSMFYYKMTLGSKIHLVWGITTTLLLLVICFAKLQLILGCREKTNSVCYWQQFSWKQWQFYVRTFKWLLGKV